MMDAVEFFKQRIRMCDSFGDCKDCRIGALKGSRQCFSWCWSNPEEAVQAVEQWTKEHPAKTRQSEFLKHWPDARINTRDGLPMTSPCALDGKLAGICDGIPCKECRKAFWLAEVEDE